ncbi:MAG: hypothetical protein ACREM1_06230 [Longimicrobiales bacterium]
MKNRLLSGNGFRVAGYGFRVALRPSGFQRSLVPGKHYGKLAWKAISCRLSGLLVLAACAGGEPPAETQESGDPSAMEEQEAVAELETGQEGEQPAATPGRGEEPGGAPGADPTRGSAQPEPDVAPGAQLSAGQDTVEGVIAVTGTTVDSRPVLQTAEGPLGVTGALTAELRRLSGARVRVDGERRAGRMPGESIDVASYMVLEVNGERPEVGTITLREGTPWLIGADTVRLIGASDRLTGLDAAKVWVTGRRTAEGLEVGSYGVIRR